MDTPTTDKKYEDPQSTPANLVEQILQSAVASRASDIHLDPSRDSLAVRFRVDGILYPFNSVPNYYAEAVISRIKILAQMDIGEKRFPQDGHFEFDIDGKLHNFRVSTIPSMHGLAVVLRLLKKGDTFNDIADLGMDSEQTAEAKSIVNSPHGMVLISGPTGSGKTTFLYSVMGSMNRVEKGIVTLEDPVELEMEGVRQMQINESVDLTFSKAARAVLRQNPDVIMIGEIRDNDTAAIAFRAALSGILVFSSFHTFDTPGLIIRMVEMGIPRSVIAYGLAGMISTRLVRKICNNCAAPYVPTDFEMKVIGEAAKTANFMKGKGCEICRGTGFMGRTGIFEVIRFDDEIRSKIIEDISRTSLKDFFDKKIRKSLRMSAYDKVIQGETTVEEIVHIVGYE
ncbi:MAG: type II/IV secretion system protein [Candidatus Taylorbacteria bacterium]|nr:type II/IV secretion system protein [Candidatus Taylorbacteria bacterium]